MQKYAENLTDLRGNVLAGVSVTVTTLAGAAATLYSDNGVTPISGNVVQTDAFGYFSLYAANGRYSFAFSGAGIQPYTRTDIVLFDPADDRFSIKDFLPTGYVIDGSVDYTVYANYATTALGVIGGGKLDISGGRWLIDSNNWTIPKNVLVSGGFRVGTNSTPDFSAFKPAIILNQAYSINLNSHGAGIDGCYILRKGLTVPTTLRQALDLVRGYSGTAITVGNGAVNSAMSTYAGHLMILGFTTAYQCIGQARPVIEFIMGDCTNGLELSGVHDFPQGPSDCEFWDFLSFGAGAQTEITTITNAVNNGSGLIRITLSAASIMTTGDSAAIWSVGGTVEANGRWTLTQINTTTFDLQGSTFTNAYTSGGSIGISSSHRAGFAYSLHDSVDWGELVDCKSFGYLRGVSIVNTGPTNIINSQNDDWVTIKDPTRYGIYIDTPSPYGVTVTGGCNSSKGANVYCKSGSVSLMGVRSVNAVNHLYQINAGTVTASGCYGTGTGDVRVDSGATSATFLGGDLTGISVSIDPAVNTKVTVKDVAGQSNRVSSSSETLLADVTTPTASRYAASATANGWRNATYHSRGTTAAPAVSQSLDVVDDSYAYGYDGSAYQRGVIIQNRLSSAPSAGIVPMFRSTFTVNPSTGALVEASRVLAGGGAAFGIIGAALPNASNYGHLGVPTVAGTPTGVPTVPSGTVGICFDTTANKLWAYNGGWKSVTLA